jgi:2-(1,2-epoxy-1,2-dihydrophenyl)acetyl-CoA isomerase
VPTIAAVNGPAAGAGANLALACDVVIAAQSAIFLQAFARIGLIPDAGGTYWLPRQIGFARAMGAVLFAEPVTATKAVEWGMIWEAVPDEEFAQRVQARAEQLAQGPTATYRLAKEALRRSWGNDVAAQLALEAELQNRAGATADFREGVAAFLEKRPARYQGR